jgi:hypothetical protein
VPRIRTIKPEFWDSPGTARASLRARLFFVAMWGWADDWGVGTANAKQLVGYAFPNDDDVTAADFPRLAAEVADCYGVQWYTVDDRPYFAIPSWDNHQKNERRANKRNPTPDQGKPTDTEMRGTSVQSDGKTPIGTGEQGNRGTVSNVHPAGERKGEYPKAFEEWWLLYPRKESKGAALKAWEKARKIVDLETLAEATQAYTLMCLGKEKQFVKLPAGWLNDRKWEDDYGFDRQTPKAPTLGAEGALCADHKGYPLPCIRCAETEVPY